MDDRVVGSDTRSLTIPILSAANFIIGMGALVVIGLINPISADLGIGAARAGALMTI